MKSKTIITKDQRRLDAENQMHFMSYDDFIKSYDAAVIQDRHQD